MKLIFAITCLLLSTTCLADQFSMRRCMILPITDTAGNSLGFKVYENLERHLKREKWCEYVSSSEIIEVFSKYRDKLPEFLKDPNVLKTVAQRLEIGTIIRVNLEYGVDSITVAADIVGENGVDIYFGEKILINKIDIYDVNSALVNWMNLYESTIPYDGKVLGILGDQVTFKVAGNKRVAIGQEFKLKRFIKKRRHPLLKKIVEWDSEVIAKGKIFNVSKGQALGVIKVYTSKHKVLAGDWVRLEKFNPRKIHDDKNFSRYEKQKFGRLGDLSLSFVLSSHTTTTTAVTGSNKVNGFLYGISAELESWITRNYFVGGEFSKMLGNLSKSSGTPAADTPGQNVGVLKLVGGYKYLPMGFFYGPQINLYSGWAKYSYAMDVSATDGYGSNSFSGILFGAGGSMPLKKGIRVIGSGEIMPFGDFTDDDNLYGSKKSISSLVIELGALYQWNPNIKIKGSFKNISNSGKFSGQNSELKYSDSGFKLGGVIGF
ncbi:MAG: hypothetical protein HON90_17305 [Halobacteriovoraceae bacterium]|jgi:hypothetical protein|nr:hypothetical protein [Halobacteriovoraceae bacterium]